MTIWDEVYLQPVCEILVYQGILVGNQLPN